MLALLTGVLVLFLFYRRLQKWALQRHGILVVVPSVRGLLLLSNGWMGRLHTPHPGRLLKLIHGDPEKLFGPDHPELISSGWLVGFRELNLTLFLSSGLQPSDAPRIRRLYVNLDLSRCQSLAVLSHQTETRPAVARRTPPPPPPSNSAWRRGLHRLSKRVRHQARYWWARHSVWLLSKLNIHISVDDL